MNNEPSKTIIETAQNNPMLTAGKVLAARRKELNLPLSIISKETKVREDYLEMIEKDLYSDFDSSVFVNGFIKIYADYLGLDVQKVSALYRRSVADNSQPIRRGLPKEKRAKKIEWGKFLTPQNMAIAGVLIFVLVIIGYLSVQFYNFRRPPILSIQQPSETSTTVQEEIFTLKGRTERETTVYINDIDINVEDNFTFTHEINLTKGANTITIRAVKKNNTQSESTKVIEITYDNPNQELEEEVEEVPEEFVTTITIKDAQTWLQIIVDDKQEVAQIVPAGFSEEYRFTDHVRILSGRPASTSIAVNGQKVDQTIKETGTSDTTCSIKRNSYICN